MHDGPIRPSGSDPLPPIPTLPEPMAPLVSQGPSVGRFVVWQLAMLLVWGGIFRSEWHSRWLPAYIAGFVLLEAFALWDFHRQRRRSQVAAEAPSSSGGPAPHGTPTS